MSGIKRKKATVGSPANKKLAGSIESLMARLEKTNASFLQQAVTSSMQTQLAHVKASSDTAFATSSPSLASLPVDQQELARRLERQQRFQEEKAAAAAAAGIKAPAKTLVAIRSEQGTARGQNQSLEKDYLRLTALPSAADVRPPEVLRQALELVKQRWTAGWEYKEACNQLKSIRQDLTVQHIRNSLTVQVYETHARIAIEVSDWAEYRQCHSVLQKLFADGLRGEQREFLAYGLLYAAATGRDVLAYEMSEAFGCSSSARSSSSSSSSCSGGGSSSGGGGGGLAGDRFVGHALAVCRAYLGGDFVEFLRLYEAAPRMAPYLQDLLLAKLRGRAYLPLAALSGWFGFSKKKEAAAFLRERGAVLAGGLLDIKASRAAAALRMMQVNRHWCEVLRGSTSLWYSTDLELDASDPDRTASQLKYGIKFLDMSFSSEAEWPDVAFILGTLRHSLRHLSLSGLDCCSCEIAAGPFLCQLRELASLELDGCCCSILPCISQLTNLQELLISREHGPDPEFEVPAVMSCLTQLTQLELVRCTTMLPVELSALTGLRQLNLEENELYDLPSSISALTKLTTLGLDSAFRSSWNASAPPGGKLSALSCLSSLVELSLIDNQLTSVPPAVAGLHGLETLKLGLNCLVELAPGPYLKSLLHLDIRASQLSSLPPYLTQATQLKFLGLSCCHDLVLDSDLAEQVLGRLSQLATITLCGQQMCTVDSARCILQLGKMLPGVQIQSHDEADDHLADSAEEDDDEEDSDGEGFTDGDEFTDEEGFTQSDDGDDGETDEEEEDDPSDYETDHSATAT
ncbi:hypothetical protein ACK3TF_000801 [Chlorella vulgaris]